MTSRVEALVVTALRLEREAVAAHLADVSVETASGLAMDVGRLVEARDMPVAVLETGPGNVPASVLTTRAEEALRPSVVVMLGIAGGVKDVDIGDVVASSKVYWVEGGKQAAGELLARPEFAPVSDGLIQIARGCAAGDAWRGRITGHGGTWPATGRPPTALVAPLVAGEKVVIDADSGIAELVRSRYSDAVALDMEDYGALRAGAGNERVRTLAIRGVSDLLGGKAAADAGGSQALAAANAAAFLADVLAAWARTRQTPDLRRELYEVGRALYPDGPQQDGLWERAGGDASRLLPSGPGASRWWHAASLLHHGAGGGELSVASIVAMMLDDYPSDQTLAALERNLR